MSSSERMRLFIAAPVPDDWHAWLQDAQHDVEHALPGYFRWTSPESWHLTVLFLGSQPTTLLPAIRTALIDVAGATPRLTLSSLDLGAPGKLDQPRLVWLRCDDGGVLGEAQKRLLAQLSDLPLETPGFKAHVTLGRARKPQRVDFRAAVARLNQLPRPDSGGIVRLILFRSHLEQTRARYEALLECGLVAPGRHR